MLSVATTQTQDLYHSQPQQHLQHQQLHPQLCHPLPPPHPHYILTRATMPHRVSPPPPAKASSASIQEISQALEIARESSDGAQDVTVCKILEGAITDIWAKVKDRPDSYIMTRDEFAVFNYFQHRFKGNATAVSARRRFWDNISV
jgi:hypothetical protein